MSTFNEKLAAKVKALTDKEVAKIDAKIDALMVKVNQLRAAKCQIQQQAIVTEK